MEDFGTDIGLSAHALNVPTLVLDGRNGIGISHAIGNWSEARVGDFRTDFDLSGRAISGPTVLWVGWNGVGRGLCDGINFDRGR